MMVLLGQAERKRPQERRRFLRLAMSGVAGIPLAGFSYALFEAGWIRVLRQVIAVPRLPAPFAGQTVAFLTDLHLS
jgi:predicted MPP superfamily phosphohydrolase